MKGTLYYFTGTGNSLVVARTLADATGDTQVMSIARFRNGEIRPAADLCRRLGVPPGAYVFGVATYGGMPGAATRQMKNIFAQKGVDLRAGFGVTMPGNCAPLYGAPADVRVVVSAGTCVRWGTSK